MIINIEEKLESSNDIQYGSIVFINVFQKDILYSSTNFEHVLKIYVTYGYKSIDDFFNTYSINNAIQEIISTKGNHPITGFVIGAHDFSVKKPHHTYNLCKLYQIIPEGKLNPFWFPSKDVYICNEKSVKELKLL